MSFLETEIKVDQVTAYGTVGEQDCERFAYKSRSFVETCIS